MALVVLLGASGAGKTTIAESVESSCPGAFDVLHFDRIGIPSPDRMIAELGSGEEWQRAMTIDWLAKLAPLYRPERGLLFEGQTRFSFLAEAAALAGGLPCHPILIDCDDEIRARRLTIDRMQPQLADATMMNWARYLRSEAIRGGHEILDTSRRPLTESVQYVVERLGR